METLVYMRFLPFSKLLLASKKVSLCALKVRLPEYEEIEKEMDVFNQKTFTASLKAGADPDRVYRFQKPGQIIREKLPSTNT